MRISLLVGSVSLLSLGGCVYGPPPGYPPPAYGAAPAAVAANTPQLSCRDVDETVTMDGKPQQVVVPMCQQPDGTWEVSPAGAQNQQQPQQQAQAAQPYPPGYAYPAYYGYPGYDVGYGYYGSPWDYYGFGPGYDIGFGFGGGWHGGYHGGGGGHHH